MRVTIEFNSDNDFKLPVQHNHLIQSFIYGSISKGLANMLHERGFEIEKRRFKLFTFSRIQGSFRIDKRKDTIIFHSPFRLVISSALKQFVEELGSEMVRKERLKIGRNVLKINSIQISKKKLSYKNRIKMLSPVTIYSTLKKADGRKKTYYYSPYEKEFSQLISENAYKKFKALHPDGNKSSPPRGGIEIVPVSVNPGNQKIINYRGTIIKGWTGIYELGGDPVLMELVYDAGLGGKNSQGFGCFEISN